MIYDSRQQNVTEIERKMWTLFDPNRETISDELSMEEAQLAIESLKSRYLNRYLIWNSEWAKWKLLNEFLRSPECPFSDYSNNLNFSRDINFEVEKIGKPAMKLVEPRKALRIQSTVSEMNTNIVELKNLVFKSKRQFDGDDLVMENLNSSLDLNFSSLSISSSFRKMNLTDKYKIQLLLIHNQGQTFRTAAKDISISGTYAERIVPQEFHSGSFNIVISNNFLATDLHKQICLSCRVVSLDGSVYLQYVSPKKEQIDSLRNILTDYRKIFESVTKSCG